MKTGTTEKMKFLRFKNVLQLPKYEAVGLLESLWQLTASNAYRGDVGRFSNEEIAAWMEWHGDADTLVSALVSCGFLDPSSEHRLVVHDWEHHAPKYIKANVSRHSDGFLKGDSPKEVPKGDSQGILPPSQAKPSQAKPSNTSPNGEESAGATDACPHQAIIDLYHASLPALPKVRQWTTARQRFLRQRWREDSKRQSLDWWKRFFAVVAASDFLCGRVTPPKDRKAFLADLEWLVRPGNFVKVLEGRYDNEK